METILVKDITNSQLIENAIANEINSIEAAIKVTKRKLKLRLRHQLKIASN